MGSSGNRVWAAGETQENPARPLDHAFILPEPAPQSAVCRRSVYPRQQNEEERRASNCNLMLVAIPFMEEMSRKLSKVEHLLCLMDRDGNLLCSIGRESRSVSRKLFGEMSGSEISLRVGPTAARTNYALIEPRQRTRQLSASLSFGAAIRDLDEAVVGAIRLSLAREEAKPQYKAQVNELADLIAVSWIQKIAIPLENAATLNLEVW